MAVESKWWKKQTNKQSKNAALEHDKRAEI